MVSSIAAAGQLHPVHLELEHVRIHRLRGTVVFPAVYGIRRLHRDVFCSQLGCADKKVRLCANQSIHSLEK